MAHRLASLVADRRRLRPEVVVKRNMSMESSSFAGGPAETALEVEDLRIEYQTKRTRRRLVAIEGVSFSSRVASSFVSSVRVAAESPASLVHWPA